MSADGRATRFALALLVVAGPLVLFVRMFDDAPRAPLEQGRARASLIVITASEWPAGEPEHPALDTLDLRAAGVERFRSPSPSTAAVAATLWTGRWPTNHGVLADDRALPPGCWTLAEAARRSGATTSFASQEPLVTRHAIGGFQDVREGAFSVADLAEYARRTIAASAGEDFVMWLHLANAGPGGRAVGELVAACDAALVASGDTYDTGLLVTAFRRSGADDLHDRLAVPFWLQLPARMFRGERGAGVALHTDLCGLLLRLYRWEPAVPARGEMRDQSRAPMLYFALRGGNAEPWYVIETAEGHLVRDVSPTTRIVYESRALGRPPLERGDLQMLQLDDAGAWVPVADDLREAVYRAHYYPRVRAFDRNRTESVPAHGGGH